MLRRALREKRPIREGGRLVAIVSPAADVLGVLALVDPAGAAGDEEQIALEHGATVLAMKSPDCEASPRPSCACGETWSRNYSPGRMRTARWPAPKRSAMIWNGGIGSWWSRGAAEPKTRTTLSMPSAEGP